MMLPNELLQIIFGYWSCTKEIANRRNKYIEYQTLCQILYKTYYRRSQVLHKFYGSMVYDIRPINYDDYHYRNRLYDLVRFFCAYKHIDF